MDIDIDRRIKEYKYLDQLKEYVKNAPKQYIKGKKESFIYPKQLEIHLPSDRTTPCNLACKHCFGTTYEKSLGRWEEKGLKLLHELKGAIPFSIFGGSYTEPTASPFLFSYLATVKQYGNHFGIHTNGTYLLELEKSQRFLTNLHEISTDKVDYISISLDAGSGISWSKLKRANRSKFWDILQSIEIMANIREKSGKDSHAIRIGYLASEATTFKEEFEFIVSLAKMYKIDSVRFSVPYDFYNKPFEEVKIYHETIEKELAERVEKYTKKLISKDKDDVPYIFWHSPYFRAIDRFDFDKCFYHLFQITMGADGFIYPCSSVAAPTASHLRRGEIPDNLEDFRKQCWDTQNNPVRCRPDCFDFGLRGNQMALEINEYYNELEK